MDLVSLGPLPAASILWHPRPGAVVLTVVARATYLLRPGESPLAPSQESLITEDRHWRDDPARSLWLPRDLVPAKPQAEVFLVGSAFAPSRRPARAVVARLAVADVDKSIEVLGERFIGPDGVVREGAPFTQMPLVYERAGGGLGTANPVGMARGARDAEGRAVLPNLQRPDAQPHAFEPVGFGPVAPSWPERLDRAGAIAAGWSIRELAAQPLPEGMDLGAFNAAPRDQRTRALGASEAMVLENLHPDHARLVTRLPGVSVRAVLEGRRGGPALIAMRADTLWIDTDRALCALTFRGMIPLEGPDEQGRVSVIMERGATADAARSTDVPLPEVRRAARQYQMTADIPVEARQVPGAALPFAPSLPAPTLAPVASFAPAPALAAPASVARPPAIESPWTSGAPRLDSPASPAAGIGPRLGAMAVPGVLDASNAAAAARAAEAPASRVEAPFPRPAPEVRAAPRPEVREALELVWFDPEGVPRLRRKPAWRAIVEAAEKAPADPDFDDPAFARDPMQIEDRREVFEILARGEALGAAALDEALGRCQRDDGRFVPTVALFTGELDLPFDEVAALRATVSTATPFLGADEALRGAVDTARELLALPDLMVAPAVAEGLMRRIDQAFAQGKRAVPADYLETQRDRVLVEQRRYQRRAVFGEKHLRALLRFDAGEGASARPAPGKASAGAGVVPVYLPESTAALLPLQGRFRARFVAEIRLATDPAEAHPAALRVLALARAVAAVRR